MSKRSDSCLDHTLLLPNAHANIEQPHSHARMMRVFGTAVALRSPRFIRNVFAREFIARSAKAFAPVFHEEPMNFSN
jgi:hypothetical protein